MAKMLVKGGNVLLLDEPTNDLDVETLRALEDALESFAGCAVVISHDRFFLDRLATHILAFEGDGHVEWFEGNFESYQKDKRRRLGDAADRPGRGAHKRLTR
jgi:ATPase subunit of ABC transporter with duplicated ATPase domains